MDNKELWFWILKDALKEAGNPDIDLNFISQETRQPAVGRAPSFVQMALYMRHKAKQGWKQYEYEFEEEDSASGGHGAAVSIVSQPRRAEGNAAGSTASRIPTTLSNSDIVDREWVKERKYAYGARSDQAGRSDYRGGLYSVVVAAHLFQKHGSVADVVLMVQISAETKHHKLPELEEQILTKAGVKIKYIPKFEAPKFEKFYSLMMEKFRILSMTEYARVVSVLNVLSANE
ncbi:MAG: hypothetical protein SGARI_001774 [Bacillariaceae sp.]